MRRFLSEQIRREDAHGPPRIPRGSQKEPRRLRPHRAALYTATSRGQETGETHRRRRRALCLVPKSSPCGESRVCMDTFQGGRPGHHRRSVGPRYDEAAAVPGARTSIDRELVFFSRRGDNGMPASCLLVSALLGISQHALLVTF